MVLYISLNFHENISNGIRVMERTQNYDRNGYVQCSREITPKVGKPELWFICSACQAHGALHICEVL